MRGPSRTLAQQAFALRAMFPNSRTRLETTRMRWTGVLTPSDLSRDYTVRIDYQLGFMPRVVVLDPELEPDADGFLPHMYNDDSLCLHDTEQWTPQMLIVDTLVPWAAEWLLHYEIWRATRTWLGDDDTDAGTTGDQVLLSVGAPPRP